MQNMGRLLWLGIGALALPCLAAAQQPIAWQPTLEGAKHLAAQTNRLVLVHFWADWCQACQTVDRGLFSQPDVASAVKTSYVPVRVNADHFPATCRQYGVRALPSDVIVTPQGRQIDKLEGVIPAASYVARLNQVAAKAGGLTTEGPTPAALPSATAGRVPPVPSTAGYDLPGIPGHVDQRDTGYYHFQRRAPDSSGRLSSSYGGQPTVTRHALGAGQPQPSAPGPRQAHRQPSAAASEQAGPSLGPPFGQHPPANPPLGLDGYCPVQLCDDMKAHRYRWTLGDRRWGAIHRGRTYLFAGPEQQRRFLADPDGYAPVLSGNDVVVAVEQGRSVPGHRRHGVFFADQVYLFASESSLEKFTKDPDRYAQQVLQAMQVRAPRSHRRR